MKRVLITLLFIVFTVGIFAHPAAKISLFYEEEDQMLTINFVHTVKDNDDHYIGEVEISVNKKVVLTHTITTQDEIKGGTLKYKLPGLKEGDVIKVKTVCNKGGTKTEKLKL